MDLDPLNTLTVMGELETVAITMAVIFVSCSDAIRAIKDKIKILRRRVGVGNSFKREARRAVGGEKI